MGMVPLSLETLMRYIHLVGGLNGCRMMELGDQQMMTFSMIPEGISAKEVLATKGVKHTSIDINGELGALPLDLSTKLEQPEWHESFDVVTDFGTSEHVGPGLAALWQCRENCHRWCRPGGIMVFMNPRTLHWPQHGVHYFTPLHYERVAAACSYKVLEISEHPACGNAMTGIQVHAVLQKRSSAPFVTKEQFLDICQGSVFTV